METYDVILSQDAENDLNSIFSYISDVLGSPINAMNQYRRIMKAILSLEFMPDRIKLMELNGRNNTLYRRLNVDNYAVIFGIEDGCVNVYRVLFSGSDIPAWLI